MQEYEEELYQKTRIVAEVEMTVALPEEGFNIEFPDPRFIDEPADELEFSLKLKEQGYISDLDIYRQFVSTRDTDDEAIKSMQQNAIQNRRKAGIAGLFTGTGATPEESDARTTLLNGQ
jgi:hypothetical protein